MAELITHEKKIKVLRSTANEAEDRTSISSNTKDNTIPNKDNGSEHDDKVIRSLNPTKEPIREQIIHYLSSVERECDDFTDISEEQDPYKEFDKEFLKEDLKSRLLDDAERIEEEHKKPITIDLSSIIGHNNLKTKIYETLSSSINEDPIVKAYLKRIGDNASQVLLLDSLPGVGKTMILRAVEKALKNHPIIECAYVPCSKLQGTVGNNGDKISKVFDTARATRKKVYLMLLDEVECIFQKGKNWLNAGERIGALLSEMDGMKDSSKIIMICTTNHKDNLDDAILSRCEEITLYPPTEEDRKEMIKLYLLSLPLETASNGNELDIKPIVQLTDGFTGRDFYHIGKALIKKYARNRQLLKLSDLATEISNFKLAKNTKAYRDD